MALSCIFKASDVVKPSPHAAVSLVPSCLPLPLLRSHVITLGPPRYSRIISLLSKQQISNFISSATFIPLHQSCNISMGSREEDTDVFEGRHFSADYRSSMGCQALHQYFASIHSLNRVFNKYRWRLPPTEPILSRPVLGAEAQLPSGHSPCPREAHSPGQRWAGTQTSIIQWSQ